VPATEYDQHGEVIDNIPAPSPESVKKLRVVDQRPIFAEMQKEIQATGSIAELQSMGRYEQGPARIAQARLARLPSRSVCRAQRRNSPA
jgi:hypothetical protein